MSRIETLEVIAHDVGEGMKNLLEYLTDGEFEDVKNFFKHRDLMVNLLKTSTDFMGVKYNKAKKVLALYLLNSSEEFDDITVAHLNRWAHWPM